MSEPIQKMQDNAIFKQKFNLFITYKWPIIVVSVKGEI